MIILQSVRNFRILGVRYTEYLPSEGLHHLVECYWRFSVGEVDNYKGNMKHVFPPDGGCSMIFFNAKNLGIKKNVLLGPTTTIREVEVFPHTVSIGIRLKAGCGTWLHDLPASELLNITIHYDPAQRTSWQNQILNELDFEDNPSEYLDERLLKLLIDNPFSPDEKIINAVDMIKQHAGQVTVEKVAWECNLSQRQLQRLFLYHTGMTVKKFCQIRRLRQAIIDMGVNGQTPLAMITERGFVDMAHYYKSFRSISGYNIERFFKHISGIKHELV